MKLATVLGICLVSSLFSAVAFAQGPPQGSNQGTVTITYIKIEGTYYSGMFVGSPDDIPDGTDITDDVATAGITAEYVAAPNSSVSPYGYVYGLPKLKYKYYGADESILGEPGLLDATPFSIGQGGIGSSNAIAQAVCSSFGQLFSTEQISVLGHDRTMIRLPAPAKTLIRQWKFIGNAGSQVVQSSDSKSALAPTFSTSVDGTFFL